MKKTRVWKRTPNSSSECIMPGILLELLLHDLDAHGPKMHVHCLIMWGWHDPMACAVCELGSHAPYYATNLFFVFRALMSNIEGAYYLLFNQRPWLNSLSNICNSAQSLSRSHFPCGWSLILIPRLESMSTEQRCSWRRRFSVPGHMNHVKREAELDHFLKEICKALCSLCFFLGSVLLE